MGSGGICEEEGEGDERTKRGRRLLVDEGFCVRSLFDTGQREGGKELRT